MKVHYSLGLALLAGIGIGAAAVQSLHAQAKPKAFLVSESEVLDAGALASYTAAISAVQKAAGGRSFGARRCRPRCICSAESCAGRHCRWPIASPSSRWADR